MSSRSSETEKDSDTGFWILASFGLGAGLMYFFDPQTGRRRRSLVRDQYDHLCRRFEEAQRVVVRDASHRAIGLMAQARRAIRHDEPADDAVLAERVRAALGRFTSHPGAIEVSASSGVVSLQGSVLAEEAGMLLDCVAAVRGVERVDDHLTRHDEAGDIPELQGGESRTGARSEYLQENWSPSARVAAGALGAALAATGMLRGGLRGWLLGTIGGALFTRAAANRRLSHLAGGDGELTALPVRMSETPYAQAQERFEQAPPSDARH